MENMLDKGYSLTTTTILMKIYRKSRRWILMGKALILAMLRQIATTQFMTLVR